MGPKAKQDPESVVKEIKRNTRRKFNSEEKIRIILEGLRGEDSIANICRKEGIVPGIYYKWSKAFLEAGKRQLSGDTVGEAEREAMKIFEEASENSHTDSHTDKKEGVSNIG